MNRVRQIYNSLIEGAVPVAFFGGKSRAASLIWQRLGDPINYVEPFAGSLATLLARPHEPRVETVNDKDCLIANFWRALRDDPERVARYADGQVNEADLHARHRWLTRREAFRERMKTDPHHFDAKVAGWWVWGICQWIGGGWCASSGLSRVRLNENVGVNRKRLNLKRGGIGVHQTERSTAPHRTERRRPFLAQSGQGVHSKKLPHLGKSRKGVHSVATGLWRQLPDLSGMGSSGRGVHAPRLRTAADRTSKLLEYFQELADRLRNVRVCCGEWDRVLGPSPTVSIGTTAVLLDPPYKRHLRDDGIYTEDDAGVADKAYEWAVKHGHDPRLRIALCGLVGLDLDVSAMAAVVERRGPACLPHLEEINRLRRAGEL